MNRLGDGGLAVATAATAASKEQRGEQQGRECCDSCPGHKKLLSGDCRLQAAEERRVKPSA